MSDTYLVTAKSESGDDYNFGLFNAKPTEEQLIAIAVNECEGEIFEGYCYLHFDVEKIPSTARDLPEPYTKGDIKFL